MNNYKSKYIKYKKKYLKLKGGAEGAETSNYHKLLEVLNMLSRNEHVETDELIKLLKSFKFFSDNKDAMLRLVAGNGKYLIMVSKRLKKDKSIVLAAVAQNGLALEFAEEMKKDKEVVLAAVSQNGLALKFASECLQGDKEVVQVAVAQNGMALEFTSIDLKRDYDIVESAIIGNYYAYDFLPEDMKNNQDWLKSDSFKKIKKSWSRDYESDSDENTNRNFRMMQNVNARNRFGQYSGLKFDKDGKLSLCSP